VTDSMRAFVIKKVGETGLVEKPVPDPGPEEAVVRTTAALICTSDVHTVKGALPVPDGRIDPTPMTTHTFAFDDVATAFAMMTTKDDGIIKPLITFG
jgi:threonine dehydrogenase-like Zn-dependent dehydrogenase